ncbi:MAG: small basic protein [Phycisphaerae bacterium]
MDRTLKSTSGLTGRRNVWTRAERIQKLTEEGEFDPKKDNPLGLPKVRTVSAMAAAAAANKKADEEAEAVEVAEAAAEAAEGEAGEESAE